MSKPIRVIEVQSGEVLGQFDSSDWDGAHRLACELEEMGVDAKIVAPSLPESLALSLGASAEEMAELEAEMSAEIDSHNESALGCLWCAPESDLKS